MLYKVSRDLQRNAIQYYNVEAYNSYVPMLRLIGFMKVLYLLRSLDSHSENLILFYLKQSSHQANALRRLVKVVLLLKINGQSLLVFLVLQWRRTKGSRQWLAVIKTTTLLQKNVYNRTSSSWEEFILAVEGCGDKTVS